MSIQEQLTEAMKAAMKAKDSLRLNTVRMARTALKNAEIEARQELDDTETIKVLSTLVKQRREAAEAYRETRPELAEKEELELAVLQEFVQAGKIRHVGLSNETPWGIMRFLQVAERLDLPRVVSVQNPYSLLNRSYEVGAAEVSWREHCGLLAYSPLAMAPAPAIRRQCSRVRRRAPG